MTAQLTLAVILSLAPMSMPGTAQAAGGSCASAAWRVPPDHISVFRIHRKGSDVPARVERWSFRRYVGAVMASGAWPNRVMESAKVGAVMIATWAWYQAVHVCHSFRGRTYTVSDSDQYLRPGIRPWSHIPVRTMAAVRAVWGVSLLKNGHHLRLGWSGGRCRDGYHVCEDSIRERALRGWHWRHLLRWALSPNLRIVM